MTAPQLRPDDISLKDLRTRYNFTLNRLRTDPDALPLVAAFTPFGAQWTTADAQELAADDAVSLAESTAMGADVVLNKLAIQVEFIITGGSRDKVSNPTYQLYFGTSTRTEFIRPLLGKQLDAMLKWPPLLAASTNPALVAQNAPVVAALAAASTAQTGLAQAQASRTAFRAGARTALFGAYNALATSTYAGLVSIQKTSPQLGLPNDWPSTFFQRLHTPADTTPAAVAELVVSHTTKLAKATKKQTEVAAKETAKAAKVAAKAKQREAEAAAKKAVDAAKAALRATKKKT
jgi:hypothetical protein